MRLASHRNHCLGEGLPCQACRPYQAMMSADLLRCPIRAHTSRHYHDERRVRWKPTGLVKTDGRRQPCAGSGDAGGKISAHHPFRALLNAAGVKRDQRSDHRSTTPRGGPKNACAAVAASRGCVVGHCAMRRSGRAMTHVSGLPLITPSRARAVSKHMTCPMCHDWRIS